MVVNEATSSIQAKGTKTVIAVAAAMVAAGSVAQAAEYKDTDYSQTEAVTVNDKTHSAKVDANTITVNAGADVTFKGYNDAKNLQILGGKVTIDGSENTATNWNDSGLGGYGAAVTSGSLAPTTANNTLVQNAVVTVKSANLFGGNLEDTSTTPVTYSNATFDIVDSTINLAGTSERAGMIFASKAVPLSVKNSTIAVAKDQYGVVNAHDSVVLDGATLDVKGTLAFTVLAKDKNTADAFNDAAAAADVTVEMTSGAVNVASTGVLQMKDSFVVKGGTVTNDGTVTVTGARGLTLTNSTFTNNKRLDAQSVVIGNGATVVTAVSKVNADDSTQRDPSYNVLNTTIQEGGKLQLTELNSHSTMGSDGKPAGDVDQLLLGSSIANSPATVNLEGGQVYLKDQIFQGNLQLGKSAGTGASKDPAQTAVMNVNAEGYKLANVDIRTAGSALNVGTAGGKTGSLTVNDLKIVAGAANVHNGSLTVNGKLTNPDAASVTVAKEGTLNLTKDSIGLAITAGTGDTADKVEVASGFKTLTNNGTVVVSGLTGTTVKADTVQKIVGAIAANSSKGQVKLDGLAVDATGFSGYNTTDNTLTAAAAGKLNGVHLDQFKNTTVTGVSGADNSLNSSFGAIQLADAAGTDKAAALTIGADKSIYLNNSGNLVTDKDGKLADVALADGASFVTTGNNAVVGAVTGKSGNFTVQSGSLEVKGNVDVSDLTVNGALAVNEKAAVPASGETAAVQAVEYKVTTNNLTVNQGATLNVLHDLVLNAAAQGTNFDADIDGTATVKGKLDANGRTVNVGSDTTTGSLSVGTLANAVIFADPAWENGQEAARVAVKTLEGSTVEAGRNSIVAVGTTDITKAQAALAATGFKLGEVTATSTGLVNAAVYVTAEPKVGTDGKVDYSGTTVQGKVLASGAPTQTTTTISDGLTVKNGTLAILDATGFDINIAIIY